MESSQGIKSTGASDILELWKYYYEWYCCAERKDLSQKRTWTINFTKGAKIMLGRLPNKEQIMNSPVNQYVSPPIIPTERDVREELKTAIDLLCDFNDRLNKLSWQTREIVQGWLRERY